jgi:hypothetical protein
MNTELIVREVYQSRRDTRTASNGRVQLAPHVAPRLPALRTRAHTTPSLSREPAAVVAPRLPALRARAHTTPSLSREPAAVEDGQRRRREQRCDDSGSRARALPQPRPPGEHHPRAPAPLARKDGAAGEGRRLEPGGCREMVRRPRSARMTPRGALRRLRMRGCVKV